MLAPIPNPEPAAEHVTVSVGFIVLLLVASVFVVDGALYVLAVYLIEERYIPATSIYPSLVIFLFLAYGVGAISVYVLGEKVNATNTRNAWWMKFGVTPIMMIVASLLGIALTFSGLADKILPHEELEGMSNQPPEFMLAKLGIRCELATKQKDSSETTTNETNDKPTLEATGLLTLITSRDRDYIADVLRFLKDEKRLTKAGVPQVHIHLVSHDDNDNDATNDNDKHYVDMLKSYSGVDAGTVHDQMGSSDRWIAYIVDAKSYDVQTVVPIPIMYEKQHEAYFFVITRDRRDAPGEPQHKIPTLSPNPRAMAVPSAPEAKQMLLPLFESEILAKRQSGAFPKRQSGALEVDTINLKMFPDLGKVCWVALINGSR